MPGSVRVLVSVPFPSTGSSDPMDRDRLSEIKQTDLTESRINEDFVAVLKNWGPSVLLVILVSLLVFVGYNRYQQSQRDKIDAAWSAVNSSATPAALEDVANDDRYASVFAVSHVARLSAADIKLSHVQRGVNLGIEPGAPGFQLTEEEREQELRDIDRLFQSVIDADEDEGQPARMTLHAVRAMNGMAAVMEAQGDADAARQWYERAAERAGDAYAKLAELMRMRGENVEAYAQPVSLPSQQEVAARQAADRAADAALAPSQPTPLSPEDQILQDALRSLIFGDAPADDGEAGDDA